MTDGITNEADALRVGELLDAAGRLLESGSFLEAVHSLHSRALRAMPLADPQPLPAAYSSLATARHVHRTLLNLSDSESRERSPIEVARGWLRSRPKWTVRSFVVAGIGALLLRYVWSVSTEASWQRQHPEGSWISRYYPNAAFEGFPLVRHDVGVNADFGAAAPARSMAKDNFSVRWDTCLTISHEIMVEFSLTSDDQSRLLVDDVPRVEVMPGPGQRSARVQLAPGLRHVTVEFVERVGMAAIRLEGLEMAGTTDYQFKRPSLAGGDVRCN